MRRSDRTDRRRQWCVPLTTSGWPDQGAGAALDRRFCQCRGSRAYRLVSKVFDDDQLMEATYAPAERLANGPSVAIRLMKQAVYQCLRMDFLSALDAVTGPMSVAYNTEDHHEAVAAFLEKRPPHFEGR